MNFPEAYQYKLIYIFSIPESRKHKGLLKIGDTTVTTNLPANELPPCCPALNDAAKNRINQYLGIAAINYNLEYTELAFAGDGPFRDYQVHRVLKRYHANLRGVKGKEWFRVDLPTAIDAIAQVKRKLSAANDIALEDVTLRPEQEEAVALTVNHFKRKGNDFLWNAKMRFGKTLCALEVVKRMDFAKTIIITHRPVLKSSWYDDFRKIFRDVPNFTYGTKENSFEDLINGGKHFVYFASLQDLRGSDTVGGTFDKNHAVFDTQWDFVIVDEAHEGTTTALGDNVIKNIVKPASKVLALSGTPFNILNNYADNVYTWDYVMEQRTKADWDKNHFGDPNPYVDLPQMHIYTYDLGELFDYAEDNAFSFREFFRTEDAAFVHENDVKKFLDLLTQGTDYPYSRADFFELFRHTLWIIPGVKEGKALSRLLQSHNVFCNFEVVNVAGDGDSASGNALDKVRDAIDANDYTITLSCGKLTAGVTVPEWTAVFYLAGSYSTSAANYLQTIFRVQSPCNFGGKVKQNCFVFDFAPDRALKMITEAAAISPQAGKTKDGDHAILDEFLNFCPVIAMRGSQMRYTADKLLRQLKTAWIDRAARNGFDDNSLYNDKLLRLDELDMKKFNDLSARIGSSSKPKGDIVVNEQGLDNERRTSKRGNSNNPPSPEQQEHNRQLRRRQKAIATLRQISIRMPLLIYGADVPLDEDISIDRFAQIVDDASWEEFMPKGVTKEIFSNFIQYYDPDIFIGTGNQVRARAKNADELPPSRRVQEIADLFATFKNPDKETVLTPWRVVDLHLSLTLDKYLAPDKKILEINSKSGLYPLRIAHKIFSMRLGEVNEDKTPPDELRRLWDKTVANNVFVLCKTPMAVTITRRTLLGFRKGSVNAKHFDDLINTLKANPDSFLSLVSDKAFWQKGVGHMFFDAVVGNPPYQSAGTGDNKNFAAPVYHEFIKIAYNERLTKHASLIHPARFLFNAGATPGDFAEKFLADKHVKIVRYFPKAQELFPTSDIKGGVVITEFDATQSFEPIGTFIPFDELRSIHKKVVLDNPNFQPLSEIISTPVAYRLSEKFFRERPELICKLQKSDDSALRSNVFERLAEIFFDAEPDDEHEYVQIYGLLNRRRVFKWIRRDWVYAPGLLEKYKVFVPESNSAGALGEVVSTPLVGSTQTFITVGAFDTRAEAEACIAYIRSKFCRAMLGILKVTQHNPPQTWSKVPLQDFTPCSDIDWSGSVDEQLYRKYGLSAEEVEFIERHVRAMS